MATSGQWPTLARTVPVCPLMMTRDAMRWRPRRQLREATMKAGHSVLLPVRTVGSQPAACPRRPATRTLLCTGRPFRRWRPAAGGPAEPAGTSTHRSPASWSPRGSAETPGTLFARQRHPAGGPRRDCCTVVIYAHLHPQTVGNFPGRYTGACGHRRAPRRAQRLSQRTQAVAARRYRRPRTGWMQSRVPAVQPAHSPSALAIRTTVMQ
jgi:hypothetical protein